MDLIDIIPTTGSFKLASTGKEYYLRPITLADEIWMKKTFGNKISEVFSTPDFDGIVRIVYHQLLDKHDFTERTVEDYDENGSAITEKIGGYKLLALLTKGEQEKVSMIWALNETLGVSRPKDEIESGKKKPLAE